MELKPSTKLPGQHVSCAFNRTILELKLLGNHPLDGVKRPFNRHFGIETPNIIISPTPITTFNRTILELKPGIATYGQWKRATFNRTILELKLGR